MCRLVREGVQLPPGIPNLKDNIHLTQLLAQLTFCFGYVSRIPHNLRTLQISSPATARFFQRLRQLGQSLCSAVPVRVLGWCPG